MAGFGATASIRARSRGTAICCTPGPADASATGQGMPRAAIYYPHRVRVIPGLCPWTPRDDRQIGMRLRRTAALHDVECRDRAAKTLQIQVSEVLQARHRFDRTSD